MVTCHGFRIWVCVCVDSALASRVLMFQVRAHEVEVGSHPATPLLLQRNVNFPNLRPPNPTTHVPSSLRDFSRQHSFQGFSILDHGPLQVPYSSVILLLLLMFQDNCVKCSTYVSCLTVVFYPRTQSSTPHFQTLRPKNTRLMPMSLHRDQHT